MLKSLLKLIVSFKFIAFLSILIFTSAIIALLTYLYIYTLDYIPSLVLHNILTQEGASKIIINFHTVIFDSAINHLTLGIVGLLSTIVALTGVQSYNSSSENRELLKQAKTDDKSIEELRRFLPKDFGEKEE